MNGTFTDKVVRFLNNAKQTVEKALIKGQEIVTDIRIEKLSKLSKKTIVSIGAIALTAIVICGAFALSGEQKSKGPEDALLNAQLSAAPEEETVEDPATVYYAIEIDGVPVAALPTEAEAVVQNFIFRKKPPEVLFPSSGSGLPFCSSGSQ